MGDQGADSGLGNKFGGMVRRARRLRDLSQRDLAELAEVSPSSVARAESVAGSTSGHVRALRTSIPADHPTMLELIEHERLRRSRPSWDTPQHRAFAELMSRARSG